MHYASTNKNLEVVKCLIENGAKVDLSVEFEARAYPTVASYAKYQSGYLTNDGSTENQEIYIELCNYLDNHKDVDTVGEIVIEDFFLS